MKTINNPTFKSILVLTFLMSAFSIQCPPGLDSVPPGQPLGICVVLGCSRAIKDQLCESDCVQGFAKTASKSCEVIKCISNSKTSCTQCEKGFQLKLQPFNQLLRVCVPENCASYDKSTRLCTVCQQGFVLQKNGTCALANCQQASWQSTQCLKCKQQYSIRKVSEGINACIAKNCIQFSPTSYECLSCQQTFMLTDNGTCKMGLKNCANFNQFSGLCYKCDEGYKLAALRACIKIHPNCTQYGIQGCTSCKPMYRPGVGVCQANFCQQLNENNSALCKKCQLGYKLNSNNLCEVQNCESYDKNLWRCLKCTNMFQLVSVGSFLNQNYIVQRCLTRFCNKFDKKSSLCTVCDPEYTLQNGRCVYSNCLIASQLGCQQCLEGWKKNERGNCVIYDCLEFNTLQNCKSCAPQKRLYKGTCIKDNCALRDKDGKCSQCAVQYSVHPQFSQYCVVSYCSKIDQSNGDCLQCYPNFKLNDKKFCQSIYCLEFENKTGLVGQQCTKCQDGFQPKSQYCIASEKYCAKFVLETGKCTECAAGYTLNPDNSTCVPSKCRVSVAKISYQVCKQCALGNFLTNFENGTQKCEVFNCTKFQKQKCIECAKGFTLLFDICITDGCIQFNQKGLCNACQDGFYLNITNLTCLRQKCLEDSKDACLKCQLGFFADASNNINTKGLCLPFNCESIKFFKRTDNSNFKDFVPTKCGKCAADYLMMPNQKCVAKDCITIDQITGNCRQCRPGFQLFNDGKCYLTRNNDYCPDRRYPNANFVCQFMKASNCLSANPKNTSQCYKCQDNFWLRNGVCASYVQCAERNPYLGCTKCDKGYRLNIQTRQCQGSTANCQIYDKITGECQQCSAGFQVILYPSKNCKKIPDDCMSLNPNGGCAQCRFSNRVLTPDGFCILPTNFCMNYNTVSGLCQNCEKGYYRAVNNNNEPYCIKNPANCQSAIPSGECTKCRSDFVLSQGTCVYAIQKCIGYNLDKCSRCQAGYFVDSTGVNCRQLPKYCQKVILNTDGICELCRFGFTNSFGVCVRTIQFCNEYDNSSGKCARCVPGYSLTTSQMLCLLGNV